MRRISSVENTNIETTQPAISADQSSYLLKDSQIVGYVDEQQQQAVYRFAQHGLELNTDPHLLTGITTSILDIGCGRGDFYNFLLNSGIDVNYTGFDTNPILLNAGRSKYSYPINISNDDFLQPSSHILEQKWDWIFSILTLQHPYGKDNIDKWTRLRMLLDTALAVSNTGVVLILNHSALGQDWVEYPIPNVVDLLCEYNLKFAIDNTEEYLISYGIYKVVVFK